MSFPRPWRLRAHRIAAAVITPLVLPLAVVAPQAANAGVSQAQTGGLVRLRAIDVMGDPGGAGGWQSDPTATAGDRAQLDHIVTAGVVGAAPEAVYRASRTGKTFTYSLRDLRPGATYALRVHTVEDVYTSAGKRVEDVVANGKTIISGLDPFKAAGAPYKAAVTQGMVTADAAGRVTLTVNGRVGDATVAGLEILRTGALTHPAAPADLRAAALSSRSVHLEWKGDVEAETYTVYRNGRRLAITNDPAFLDLSALPGQSYRYTVIAKGPTYLISHTSSQVSVNTPASDAPTATGRYVTRGGVVVDPQGKVFTPLGANLGTWSTATGRGQANGHAADAKAWGWNAVRLTYYVTDEFSWSYRAQHGYPALMAQLKETVAEYRAQGVVVLIDAHDTPEEAPNPALAWQQMETFWRDAAIAFKGDTGVWFNLINEPKVLNEDWYDVHDRFLRAIRGTGAQNIAVVDTPVWGQDLGSTGPWFIGARLSTHATMAPRLAARYGNVVVSQHNYGGYDRYTTPAAYGAYADSVKRTGLPLVTGETGYTVDGSTTAGGFDLNRRAALATFASNPGRHVGTFVWNGTHNDSYSLKADGGAFYSGGGAGLGLSDMGKRLWALNH